MKHYTLLYAAPPARHACFVINVFLFIFQKKGRGEVGASCLLCCKRFYSFFQKKRSGGDDADSRTIIFSFPIKEERGGAEKTTLPSFPSL